MSGFQNYAGRADVDNDVAAELEASGIEVFHHGESMRKRMGEVETVVVGDLHQWGFTRAWRYWVCSGPGLPPDVATELHSMVGTEVRVDGHCACPSPLAWHHGFAVGMYHVDTQRGLTALADAIKAVYVPTEEPS